MSETASQLTPRPDSAETQPETRLRIIQAAFRLFGRQGYARTSIQDISAAAGVKKPILYYYFASKEALYQALLAESGARMYELLHTALAATLPVQGATPAARCQERLSILAETLLALARDNQDPVRFFFAHHFAPDADRPVCCDDGIEQAAPRLLRQLVEDGAGSGALRGDPEDLLRLLLGAIQFCILTHLRHPDLEPLAPGLGRRLVGAALDGFRPG